MNATKTCACGKPATYLLLGLESRWVCNECRPAVEEQRPEPGYYLGTGPNGELVQVDYATWRRQGNA